jgi:hypothetical protein
MREFFQLVVATVGTLSTVAFSIIAVLGSYDGGRRRLVEFFEPFFTTPQHIRQTWRWKRRMFLARAAYILIFIFLWISFERGFNAALSWIPSSVGYYDEDDEFIAYLDLYAPTLGFFSALWIFSLMVEQLETHMRQTFTKNGKE